MTWVMDPSARSALQLTPCSAQRSDAGEEDARVRRRPAVELRLPDPRGALLARVEKEGEPLVGENAVDAPRHERPAPGLPAAARVRHRQLDLEVIQTLPVRAL